MRENNTGTYDKEVNAALEAISKEAKTLNFETTPVGRTDKLATHQTADELATHQNADTRSLSSAAIRGSTGESEASSLAKSTEAPRVLLIEFPKHPKDPVEAVRYSSDIGKRLAEMRQSDAITKPDFELAA
jgi:hypothetical protein